jgi:hypothetical protein
VGLTLLLKLEENRYSSLFLYQANSFYYKEEHFLYSPTYERRITRTFNNGLGLGTEIVFIKKLGLNLMGGYAYYDNFKELGLTFETALFYKL